MKSTEKAAFKDRKGSFRQRDQATVWPCRRAGRRFRCHGHTAGPLGRGSGDDLGLQSECWIPDRGWAASPEVMATWTTVVCEIAKRAMGPTPSPTPPS